MSSYHNKQFLKKKKKKKKKRDAIRVFASLALIFFIYVVLILTRITAYTLDLVLANQRLVELRYFPR